MKCDAAGDRRTEDHQTAETSPPEEELTSDLADIEIRIRTLAALLKVDETGVSYQFEGDELNGLALLLEDVAEKVGNLLDRCQERG